MRRILLLLALAFSLSLQAQNAGLDRRFGANGLVSLREPTASNARNLGMAACAMPGGRLNVVSATAADQLAVFRLKEDGSLDTSFSGDGIATIGVPASSDETVQGACMGDGRIVLSRMAPGSGADKNIQLIRLDPDGTLDTSFGVGGTRTIDLDAYEVGLGDSEYPLSLNLIAGNDILVSTRTFLSNGESRPGLIRVDVNGNIQFARLVTVSGATPNYATGAGIGNNGRIWLVGGGNPNGTPYNSWFRVELDAATGATLASFVGTDGNYIVDGGRMLANGIMVAVGKYVPQAEPGGAYRPRLLVFRDSGTTAVALPALNAVNNSDPTLTPYPGRATAIPTSDGRVLVMAPMGGQNQEWEIATYVAQVELGATAAEDRVDPRFGNHGAIQFFFPGSVTPTCANGSPPLQRMVRASNWNNRPVLVGIHAATCALNPRNTMVARLLSRDEVFFDSYEP
ncbi:MAG TPA: hypothetical protein PLB00_06610 [Pseudomonadota bacterium]|nr:hypothetical protein [Pseudomonadota bacterium]